MLSPSVGGLALELPDCLKNTALSELSRAAPAQLALLALCEHGMLCWDWDGGEPTRQGLHMRQTKSNYGSENGERPGRSCNKQH